MWLKCFWSQVLHDDAISVSCRTAVVVTMPATISVLAALCRTAAMAVCPKVVNSMACLEHAKTAVTEL